MNAAETDAAFAVILRGLTTDRVLATIERWRRLATICETRAAHESGPAQLRLRRHAHEWQTDAALLESAHRRKLHGQ